MGISISSALLRDLIIVVSHYQEYAAAIPQDVVKSLPVALVLDESRVELVLLDAKQLLTGSLDTCITEAMLLELLRFFGIYRDYVYAIPDDIAGAFPVMPGIDGDWAEYIIYDCRQLLPLAKRSAEDRGARPEMGEASE